MTNLECTEEITALNGQLIFKEKKYGIEADRRCEIFVGRVPRDARLKEDLVPVFKRVGRLIQFRLLVSFSGNGRGYGFATYATILEAYEAIKTFNNYEIKRGWYLGVCWSENRCRISLNNLPLSKTFKEIAEFIYGVADKNCPRDDPCYIVYTKDHSNATVIWEHKTHRGVAINRKDVTGPAATHFGPQTQVTWVDPAFEITVEEFPMMATRKDEFSPIVFSYTDMHVVRQFETKRLFEQSTPVVRRNTRENNEPSLMTRRKADVPHIWLGNNQNNMDLQLELASVPETLLQLFNFENQTPKEYSPATRPSASAHSLKSIDSGVENVRFRFDDKICAMKSSGNPNVTVPQVTPCSSGYTSKEISPFFGLESDFNQTSHVESNVNINMFSPSFYNRGCPPITVSPAYNSNESLIAAIKRNQPQPTTVDSFNWLDTITPSTSFEISQSGRTTSDVSSQTYEEAGNKSTQIESLWNNRIFF